MPESQKDPFGPWGPNDAKALEIFERARERAYADELSDEDLQAALAKLRDLVAATLDQEERRWIDATIGVLSTIRDIVEMDRRYAPIANSRLVAEAEAVYARAGRESADAQEFRQRLKEGIRELGELYERSTDEAERYEIAALTGSLVKTVEAVDITDPEN